MAALIKKHLLLFLLAFILCTNFTFAQSLDQMLQKQTIKCEDIAFNASILVVRLVTENKIDSANLVLSYWENKCGMRESIQRVKILIALQSGTYSDSTLDDGILAFCYQYMARIQAGKRGEQIEYDYYRPYYGHIPIAQEFDNFTKNLALKLGQQYPEGSIEHLLAEFYTANPDTLITKIQDKKYDQSKLYKAYFEEVNKFINQPEFNIAYFAGIWMPTGNLKILGNHPEVGFQMGQNRTKMSYDFTLALRATKAKNSYPYFDKTTGKEEYTNHFFGGYVGIEAARNLWVKKTNEIKALGGFGWDGFDVKDNTNEQNQKDNSQTASSVNFNFGLGYRKFMMGWGYLALHVKYNVVNYRMNNTVNFTGNPITIRLFMGSCSNIQKKSRLKALKYPYRN